MDDEVVSSLNPFDLLIRYVPGVILLSVVFILGRTDMPADFTDLMGLVLFVTTPYAVGTVLRMPAN